MNLKVVMCNVVLVVVLLSTWVCLTTASVSYDHKAIVVNGQRRILISGSIHYPRSTPEMWPDLIQKAKEGGLDVIQTYVFWNGHEPQPGKYYFEDRYDLVKFIKLVKQAGLYVHLRVGPYACAEWNFGGFPVWLKYVPGISFRTDNGPFKSAMQKFTTKIVNMMKAERLYESQGGPIIMSQIENEYGPLENEFGAPGKAYAKWAAEMAVGLGTGVPWVMCKQDDAPDPVINACNGFYCDYFSPNKAYKPKMWTEAWTGWFTNFGGAVPHRPAEDLAFSIARFIQKGGSFVNYYMYHGGTNFGRTAGGPFIATSYDYDAPLDEYGLLRQPKWGHLKDLHRAIKLCETALVSGDPTRIVLGNYHEANVFKSKSGACAAFLANYDKNSFAKVAFNNMHYNLPPWSISILPDCKNTVYNTARMGAQSAQMKMTPVSRAFSWQSYNDETASYDDRTFTAVGLLEQINTTRDVSDYLWYNTDVKINYNERHLRGGKWPVLTVFSAGHALHVFINGQLTGSVYGNIDSPKVTFSRSVYLRAGVNKISILSIAVGLPNVGTHFERWNAGVLGPVTLNGLNEGRRDLTWQSLSLSLSLSLSPSLSPSPSPPLPLPLSLSVCVCVASQGTGGGGGSFKSTSINGVKMYSVTSQNRSLATWINPKKLKSFSLIIIDACFSCLVYLILFFGLLIVDYLQRVDLIQVLRFETATTRIKATPDGEYLIASGIYPLQVKVYELRELSLKFERHLLSEIINFEVLDDDYSKIAFLCADRSV